MGRRPLASKAEVGAPSSDGGGLPLSEVVLGGTATELVPLSLDRQPENGNAASNGLQPPSETVTPSELITVPKPKRKYKSRKDPSNVKPKKPKVAIRRSGRLQSAGLPARNTGIAPIIGDLTAPAGEGEVLPRAPEETQLPELSLREKNLEEKVISLSEAVEQLRNCFEALHSKFEKMGGARSSRTVGAETSTGSLHEECQKKIEALMNENRELARKLENAHMMNSKGICLFGELLDKVKDIMLLFGLKVAEMAPSAPNATDSTPGRGPVDGMI